MKKVYFFIFCCLCVFCATILFLNANTRTPQLTNNDCVEFGMCKEGLKAIINKETFVISKETCLKYKKQWREDLKACYMY